MNAKLLYVSLISIMCGNILYASHISQIEVDLTFSLHLVIQESSTCRVERYEMQELKKGDNYITRKMSNAHCSHILNLGERGMHIAKLDLNAENARMLNVLAHRGKKAIQYTFDWATLLLSDPTQAHRAMHAHAQMKEIDRVLPENEEVKKDTGNHQ